MMQAKEFFLPFVKKEKIAKHVYSFYFDRKSINFSAKGTPASGWDFLPGQYIRMVLPHERPDERGTSRFFTIASSPLEKNHVMITTKLTASSFKNAMRDLSLKTQVKFYGPMGNFVFRDDEQSPLVLLAGGIGITAYHSMIVYAAKKQVKIPITVLVSFSTREEMIFYKELTAIANKHKNINIMYTISNAQGYEDGWQAQTGRITNDFIKKYVPDVTKPKYYIVGPPRMADTMRELVTDFGVDEEQIISENFTGY